MAKAPDVVVVARHGARLDAADKSWHFTSPTPYDPPLTYGGWNQSKALGSTIAGLLQHRAESRPATQECEEHPDWRKRYKVVIHSSPFLRCIQTSIAIGAGLAQHRDHTAEKRERRKSHGRRRRSKPSIKEEDEKSYDYFQEGGLYGRAAAKKALRDHRSFRATLRIDAFLGEWLTPDYYEDITPPPGSTMMVAGAKADLLRYEQIEVFQQSTAAKGNFPGGWNRPGSSEEPARGRPPSPAVEDNPLSMTSMGQGLPRTQRASSHSSIGSTGSRKSHKLKDVYSSLSSSRSIYAPPVPAYAISPAEPIPRGYVAHARDACIDIDFQWDSMRPPQNWGDGGEYGEEWSAMHKRFRLGLYRLITWYKEHEVRFNPYDPGSAVSSPGSVGSFDDDRELVVIMVTHGAGCNALIGALTNQPVLMDVGLASLTVAARRDSPPLSRGKSVAPISHGSDFSLPPRRRSSTVDYGIADEYEMKLIASSDHLRAGADASRATALQSPNLVPRIPEYRRRVHANIGPSSLAPPSSNGFFRGLEPGRATSSALGSIRRSPTGSGGNTFNRYDSTSPSRTSTASGSGSNRSSGLWTKNPNTPSESNGDTTATEYSVGQIEELSLGPALNRSPRVHSPTRVHFAEPDEDGVAALPTGVPSRSLSQHGLWGSNTTVSQGDHSARPHTPKRRWTVNQNDG